MRRPVAFHPSLARLFGGVNEALLWQQLYYWSDKGSLEDGWIYKTKEELEEETTLSRDQQDVARKKLVTLGVLEVELRKTGAAPTLHYKVHPEAVESLYSGKSDYRETHESNSGKPDNPLYTESTHTSTNSVREPIEAPNDDIEDRVEVPVDDWGEEIVPRWKKRDTSYREVFVVFGGKEYPKSWERWASMKKAAEGLMKDRGIEQIKKAVAFYRAHEHETYCPQLSTPIDLDQKWDALLKYKHDRR